MVDWKKPLLDCKKPLLELQNAAPKIYQGIVLSTKCKEDELSSTIPWLEPAIAGNKNCIRSIPVCRTENYHNCLFFGEDKDVIFEIDRIFLGIEDVYRMTPSCFLPSISLPSHLNQRDRNIITALVIPYYLASRNIAPYLALETEYQESVQAIYFESLSMRRKPLDFSSDWLLGIGTHDTSACIAKWHHTLNEQGRTIPDVIDGFIWEDFVSSFIKAIDILCFVLPGEQQRKKADTRKGNKVSTKSIVCPKWTTQKVRKDIECLVEFFLAWHNPASTCRFGKERNPSEWLTEEKIAKHLEWFNKDGDLDQVRVSRRMERIFGPNPSAQYRSYFCCLQNSISRCSLPKLINGKCKTYICDPKGDKPRSNSGDNGLRELLNYLKNFKKEFLSKK